MAGYGKDRSFFTDFGLIFGAVLLALFVHTAVINAIQRYQAIVMTRQITTELQKFQLSQKGILNQNDSNIEIMVKGSDGVWRNVLIENVKKE